MNPCSSVPSTRSGATKRVEPAWLPCCLKLPGALVGAAVHDGGVPPAERGEEVLEPCGQAGEVGGIGDDAVGAEHVMGIGGPLGGDDAAEDDVGRLLHRELGALDEVGEVRLEEGERRRALGVAWLGHADHRRVLAERLMQHLEERDAVGVVGPALLPGAGRGRAHRRVAGAKQRADQLAEAPRLLLQPKGRPELADLVTELVGGGGAAAAEEAVEPLLKLPAGERAGDVPSPAPRRAHVFEEGAGGRAEEQPADEGPVARQRRMAWPGAQRHAGQFDVALAIGDQEDGAVARGGVLQGGAVGDERAWRVGADKLPEVAADDRLGRIGEIAGIETGAELAQLALPYPARDGGGQRRFGDEGLRQGVQRRNGH